MFVAYAASKGAIEAGCRPAEPLLDWLRRAQLGARGAPLWIVKIGKKPAIWDALLPLLDATAVNAGRMPDGVAGAR
jgi:hypothetical protein